VLQSGQKLNKFSEGDWLDEMGWFFVDNGKFIIMNHPAKFQPKEIKESSTSFANRKSEQNLQRGVLLKF